MLNARHVMTRRVETLSPDMTVRQAADLLLERRISGAPVVDASGRLLGLLSQKDILAAERQPQAGQRPVRELMVKDVIAVDEDAGLVEIARLMSDRRIHRVLVLRGRHLSGIISALDILRALADAFDVSQRRAARTARRPARGRIIAGRRT